MVHHSVVQGSEEWLRLRLGRPTASEFSRIITPKKWQVAAGRIEYAIELVTELALDCPLDGVTTPAMIHGKDWEPKAIRAYEMIEGVDVEPCGFCTTDDGMIGASPDSFVGEDGSLEIKCPEKPEVHMGYLLHPGDFSGDHWVQVQGQLYVTGRKWTDLVSYFMGLPMARVRITPHEEFQTKLDAALKQFLRELTDLIEAAKAKGVRFRERKVSEPKIPSKDWITEEDVEVILAGRFGEDSKGG